MLGIRYPAAVAAVQCNRQNTQRTHVYAEAFNNNLNRLSDLVTMWTNSYVDNDVPMYVTTHYYIRV